MPNKTNNNTKKTQKSATKSKFFVFFSFLLGVPIFGFLALYIVLLFTPISLHFIREPIQKAALSAIPQGYNVELGEIKIALKDRLLPSIEFSPAIIIDEKNAVKIKLEALNIGFSPLKSLIGQPALNISLISPHLKVIQDLLGPRLADFEIIDENGEDAAIYILEGETSYPKVRITPKGLDLEGATENGQKLELRTDNNLAIYNFLAIEESLALFHSLLFDDKISRLKVVDASLDMHDSVYGLLRQFSNINIELSGKKKNGFVRGVFSINLAGRITQGTFTRLADKNNSKLSANISNLDFSSILPFLDDKNSIFALEGAGDLALEVNYNLSAKNVIDGSFDVDNIDAQFRINKDYFPFSADKINIKWNPELAKYSIEPTQIRIGNSSGKIGAQFILGLDEKYGPTMRMSVEAQRVFVYPNDLLAPNMPFDNISLIGWSAPLYGALGIDYLLIQKQGVEFRTKGRLDLLRNGLGINLEIGGEGANADDLKRLWPYFIATKARKWFVKNVKSGQLLSANMKFNFPSGSIANEGEYKPIAKGAINIDMAAKNVSLIPLKGMKPVKIDDIVTIKMRDNIVSANMKSANIATKSGTLAVENGSFILDIGEKDKTIYELSGDVKGKIPAFLQFMRKYFPKILQEDKLAIKFDDFNADIDSSIVATITSENDEIINIDYAATGRAKNFASKSKLAGYEIKEADFNFALNQDSYNINGDVKISGIDSKVKIDGTFDSKPDILLSTKMSIKQLKQFGFDLSEFLQGNVDLAVRILENGKFALSADLKNTSINVVDLAIKKAKNIAGRFEAIIEQTSDEVFVSNADLRFSNVRIIGDINLKNSRLKSANFSTFALSKNDNAGLHIEPTKNGYALTIRGKVMDLKPVLNRAFSLEQPSPGRIQSTQYDQRLLLDIQLKQAIGFYKTIANNFNLKMDLRGSDIRDVSLQAQFAKGNSVSVSTNPLEGARTMSVAFNDAGTLLRFLNIYPRLLGGRGSFVLTTNNQTKVGKGVISLSDFSIIDEEKIAQILGSYEESRQLIARENKVSFNHAKVEFIRRSDRIEITNGVIDGGDVGGTLRGFIYTDKRQYDLNGTYIPLFGLNSIFQKLPLFGVILGGREGEGLIGVTFAIRGSLDKPVFVINPASILAPGMFRSLFEFRAQEAPRAE